jgi:hydrogenase expression/formation protein HypC
MCLGVPGQVVQWIDRDPTFARARIEFDGIGRECHMACVLEAEVGDYVIVHAGIAICRLDADEADRVLTELRRLDLAENWSEENTQADHGMPES